MKRAESEINCERFGASDFTREGLRSLPKGELMKVDENSNASSLRNRKKLLRGTLFVGLCTMVSRLLGMLRDMATAATFGMSVGGVMDSFVVAFRLPDMARKLFGDGTISVSFIPVFGKIWREDRKKAWNLLSVMLGAVFIFLTIFVVAGEILCYIGFTFFSMESKVYLISHLVALMLPYLILICMAAIASAALQTLEKFSIPAMIPSILNIIWLFGILIIAPNYSSEPAIQCYILTSCILIAGVIQLFIHYPFLCRLGFCFDFGLRDVRIDLRLIFRDFLPQIFGLASLQINILVAIGVAWFFSGHVGDSMRWLGGLAVYPLRIGATSSIYYSERVFDFPQGLIGMAIATVIYPLLSRHAASRDFKMFGEDLSIGIRILTAFAIPSSAGLMIMSERISHLLFQRGAFTPDDMFRTADMIFWFGLGVWSFCLTPVIVRAFYLLEDISTPFRVGVIGVVINLILDLALIWNLHEAAFAIATSISACIQTIILFIVLIRKHGYIDLRGVSKCFARSIIATAAMIGVVLSVVNLVPIQGSISDIVYISVGGITGAIVYALTLRLMGGREIVVMLRGHWQRKSNRKHKQKQKQIQRKMQKQIQKQKQEKFLKTKRR
ncbi:MAG: murein biosynthesis integral membrane protein MurJ [Planctomycetaceae bacterium]|nr:murein biosynthesis integral membrane protein MurJ [Planctomycetaceae bacterium]